MAAPRAERQELRPDALLAIGIAHSDHALRSATELTAIDTALSALLHDLGNNFAQITAQHPGYFASSQARGRILHFWAATEQSSRDETTAFFQDITFDRTSALSASGCSNAHHQLRIRLLANIDLLVAIWEDLPGAGKNEVDSLVQEAVSKHMPVIVIAPSDCRTYLLLRDETDLDDSQVDELRPRPASDIPALLKRLILPPSPSARQSLSDLCNEPDRVRAIRKEYDLLMTVFGARHPPTQTTSSLNAPALSETPHALRARSDRIDQLAGHYANLSRSSATSQFVLLIITACVSSSLNLIFPSLSGLSILIQVIVNGLILIDMTVSRRRRWIERWLDYRALAERLRVIQLLHPIGLGDGMTARLATARPSNWTDWYCRRTQRMLDPPSGAPAEAEVSTAKTAIRAALDDQLAYHRRAFVQFTKLSRRLYITARIALVATILIGLGLAISGAMHLGDDHTAWRRLALLALAVFPATIAALNGIRSEADLVQLVQRSAQTFAQLSKLKRALDRATSTESHVRNAALRLAGLMEDELSWWKLMVTSRRLRRTQ